LVVISSTTATFSGRGDVVDVDVVDSLMFDAHLLSLRLGCSLCVVEMTAANTTRSGRSAVVGP
jgi:hypothetical protein